MLLHHIHPIYFTITLFYFYCKSFFHSFCYSHIVQTDSFGKTSTLNGFISDGTTFSRFLLKLDSKGRIHQLFGNLSTSIVITAMNVRVIERKELIYMTMLAPVDMVVTNGVLSDPIGTDYGAFLVTMRGSDFKVEGIPIR
eukprot:TRINITY_DN7732_c0_g1_i3.p1 TRINITY_DN7732_c0_g1~~TRINITY_DN7732_c0_g1_i3.p1  ORF type:complete len:140 (-),score=15.51 TRINITY_DN7732_c0_g1_i3:130-549(-)